MDEAEFARWFDDPKGNFVIENLPPRVKKALGTQADSLIFSTDTLTKQKEHHKKISSGEYIKVLDIIKDPDVDMRRTRVRHIGLIAAGEEPWTVVIKTTQDRLEAYLVSLHRLHEKSLRRFKRYPPA